MYGNRGTFNKEITNLYWQMGSAVPDGGCYGNELISKMACTIKVCGI